MSILDKTADEIIATIGGGYQPNEDETLFLALKSNFSREERIYIFKRLVLTQDQISAIIDITPAQWILDVIAMFEGRLSRSHWFSIVQKARLPTRINDIEFIPADALVFFYFKKLSDRGRVPIVPHTELDQTVFLTTSHPKVSIVASQATLNLFYLALFRTENYSQLLATNIQRARTVTSFALNPFTIALLRASPLQVQKIYHKMTTQWQIEPTALQREIYNARRTLTKFEVDMVSAGSDVDRRDILFKCCPTCVLSKIDNLANVTREEKIIGMIRSTTSQVYTGGFGQNSDLISIFLYQRRHFPINSFTAYEYASLEDHLCLLAFLKCPQLYTMYEIPSPIRALVLSQFDHTQIEYYFRRRTFQPDSIEKRDWMNKLPDITRASKWIEWLDDADKLVAIGLCQDSNQLNRLIDAFRPLGQIVNRWAFLKQRGFYDF